MKKLNKSEIEKQYSILKNYHNTFLKEKGVKLPSLIFRGNYSKAALTLIYLSLNYPNTKVVSKDELTQFIRLYYNDTNDVQQARHLAAQNGFFIASGQRNDASSSNLKSGEYQLITLEKPYPGFNYKRRNIEIDNFEDIKKLYNYRCATCGSKEGKPSFHWPSVITTIQKGHMNPNKPLNKKNIIPQCQQCNRADRNNWIYDSKGRVVAIANPNVILNSDIKTQKEIFKLLKNKFNK